MYKTRIKEKWWFSQCGWKVSVSAESQVLIPAEHLWCDFKCRPWAKNVLLSVHVRDAFRIITWSLSSGICFQARNSRHSLFFCWRWRGGYQTALHYCRRPPSGELTVFVIRPYAPNREVCTVTVRYQYMPPLIYIHIVWQKKCCAYEGCRFGGYKFNCIYCYFTLFWNEVIKCEIGQQNQL